jgi:hypothetical protein
MVGNFLPFSMYGKNLPFSMLGNINAFKTADRHPRSIAKEYARLTIIEHRLCCPEVDNDNIFLFADKSSTNHVCFL